MFFVVLAFIIIVLLILYVIGRLITVSYTVERSEFIEVPPSLLWTIIINHSSEKDWRNNLVESVKVTPVDGKPVWKEVRRNNETFLFQTVESDASTFTLERKIIDNQKFEGGYRLQINEEEGASRLHMKHSNEVYRPISKMLYTLFPTLKQSFVKQYLADVKHRALHIREERDGILE